MDNIRIYTILKTESIIQTISMIIKTDGASKTKETLHQNMTQIPISKHHIITTMTAVGEIVIGTE